MTATVDAPATAVKAPLFGKAEKKAVQDKEDADKKAIQDKDDAEKKAAQEKEEAEAKAKKDQEEAEAKAKKDQEEADAKQRQKEMDEMANNGIAAHFLYKSNTDDLNASHNRAREWVQRGALATLKWIAAPPPVAADASDYAALRRTRGRGWQRSQT